MKTLALRYPLLITLGLLLAGWGWGTPPDRAAYQLAKGLSVEQYRSHVLSLYGKGDKTTIHTWHINFFDPDSATKGKVVVVQNGAVTRSHAAEWRSTYDDALSFDPALSPITVDMALRTARAYAEQNQILYDSTTVLLRRTEVGKAPFWRVELRQDGHSRGFVTTRSDNGALEAYAAPEKEGTGLQNFGRDVESTFKGIGADLENFFTGERTVDK